MIPITYPYRTFGIPNYIMIIIPLSLNNSILNEYFQSS